MSKRFTDTDKWFDEWYRKLPIDYKLFWTYLCDRCNNAGVWKIDIELANFVMFGKEATGVTLEKGKALYGDRIHPLRPGYWLLRGFVPFQFGELSPNNRMHASVLSLLQKEGAYKALKRPIHRGQEKEQGQGKEKKGGVGGIPGFDAIWSRYPRRLGRKEAERHFYSSVKTPQDWLDINNALDNYLAQIRREHIGDEFIKHGSTWFNNWRDYVSYRGVELPKPPKPAPKPREPEPPPETQEDIDERHRMTVDALYSGRCPEIVKGNECRVHKKEKEAANEQSGS